MAQAILVIPTGRRVGLTSVAVALVHALDRRGVAVSFCKPIAQQADDGPERSTAMVQSIASLEPPVPMAASEVEHCLAQGDEDQVLEEVISRYNRAAQGSDIVIVEGLVDSDSQPYASRLNRQMASSLDAMIILVSAPGESNPEQLSDSLEFIANDYGGVQHQRILGCILNQVGAPSQSAALWQYDSSSIQANAAYFRSACRIFHSGEFRLLGCVPWQGELLAPRVQDLLQAGVARAFHSGNVQRRIQRVHLLSGSLEQSISQLQHATLVITSISRYDIILAAACAALSGDHIAALLLSDAGELPAEIVRLCRPAMRAGLPLLLTANDSLSTVLELSRISLEVPLDDVERIERVIRSIADHLELDWEQNLRQQRRERRLSPAAFRYQLVEQARAADRWIVLPEGDEPRTLQAASICYRRSIAHCLLLGNPQRVREAAARNGINLPKGIEIVDPVPLRERYLTSMLSLRRHKGLRQAEAEEALQDNVVVATMMLARGDVDGLVSGAVHTTANTIRPALQLIGTHEDSRLVSSVFYMLLPEQVLVYGDCAINPDPNPEELADIAIQSAASAEMFGIPARVAMISYSTGTSGSGSNVEKVRQATRIAQQRRPDLLIDGPLQYDAAAIADVGRSKAPDSPVAGQATVFIFPDLNTGNTTYKAVQRSADVISVGPMLQGLRKPVNDLSRGALVEDILYTIALTAIQAQQFSQRNSLTKTS